jgi:bla regulator protein blaR1
VRGVGGGLTVENIPLRALITFAYDIGDEQLSGGPRWIEDDHFDIIAKLDMPVPEGPEGDARIKLMLRSLLADRFQLMVHRETRERPVYALIIARKGAKLKESAAATKGPNVTVGRGLLRATKVKMDTLARALSNQLERTVIDRTGLTADYDFELKFSHDIRPTKAFPGPEKSDAPPAADAPDIFTALQEQLGLKLESQNGPVEMIVIDRVEKPSSN